MCNRQRARDPLFHPFVVDIPSPPITHHQVRHWRRRTRTQPQTPRRRCNLHTPPTLALAVGEHTRWFLLGVVSQFSNPPPLFSRSLKSPQRGKPTPRCSAFQPRLQSSFDKTRERNFRDSNAATQDVAYRSDPATLNRKFKCHRPSKAPSELRLFFWKRINLTPPPPTSRDL